MHPKQNKIIIIIFNYFILFIATQTKTPVSGIFILLRDTDSDVINGAKTALEWSSIDIGSGATLTTVSSSPIA